MTILLKPAQTALAELELLYRDQAEFDLSEDAYQKIALGHARLSEKLSSGETIYGVNTGFGKLASVRIDEKDLSTLQTNLVRSHCAGIGDPLPAEFLRKPPEFLLTPVVWH